MLLLFLVGGDSLVLILWRAGVQHCKLRGAMCQQYDFVWSSIKLSHALLLEAQHGVHSETHTCVTCQQGVCCMA